jgi:predicted  nucleic acid-binding Zn-ribbon protein
MNASVLRANETTNMRVDTVERRVKSWQENMADEMGALKEVPKMCKQLTIINERNDDFQSKMFSINDALASLKFQQRTMKETLEPKVDDLFSTLNRLDNAVMEDRGNNLILITKTCDQMFDRLKLELGKL